MQRRPLSPPQGLAVSFGVLILLGTVLLSLPVSSTSGAGLAPVDALFTSTSAVCVTGLIVVDTSGALSLFGQLVVLALIQAGGLGYMTISTVVAVALGRRMSITDRLALKEALNLDSMEGLVRFALTVFRVTAAFELAGAVLEHPGIAVHTCAEGEDFAGYIGNFKIKPALLRLHIRPVQHKPTGVGAQS